MRGRLLRTPLTCAAHGKNGTIWHYALHRASADLGVGHQIIWSEKIARQLQLYTSRRETFVLIEFFPPFKTRPLYTEKPWFCPHL